MPLGDINLSSNFSLSSQRPLDDRLVLDDIAERNAMDIVRRYNLMIVHIISTGLVYQLVLGTVDSNLANNANWIPLNFTTDTFLELTDTNADYTGHAGEVPIVNETEDALEFGLVSSGFVTIGTDGMYATINAALTDSEYNMRLISNITETADVNLTVPIDISCGTFSINMATYDFNVLGANIIINNLRLSVGTITIGAAATNSVITGCKTVTSIVDSGTTSIIRDNQLI